MDSSPCLSQSLRAHLHASCLGPQSKCMQISHLRPKLAPDGHCPRRALNREGGSWRPFVPQCELSTYSVQAGLWNEHRSGSAALLSLTVPMTPCRVLVNASLRTLVGATPGRSACALHLRTCTPVPLRCLWTSAQIQRTYRLLSYKFCALFCMLESLHNKNLLGWEAFGSEHSDQYAAARAAICLGK